jgi:hypothetical protein
MGELANDISGSDYDNTHPSSKDCDDCGVPDLSDSQAEAVDTPPGRTTRQGTSLAITLPPPAAAERLSAQAVVTGPKRERSISLEMVGPAMKKFIFGNKQRVDGVDEILALPRDSRVIEDHQRRLGI